MNVFLHNKNDLKKNVISFIICLLPLYFYGIYKNGILLYNKSTISFFSIFKLFYLVSLGIVAYALVCLIFKKKIKFDLNFLSLFIIPLFMMPNINYWFYFFGIFSGLIITVFLEERLHFKLNKIVVIKLIITSLVLIFSTYTYQNVLEAKGIYAFNFIDLLWGRNVGGLGSTSIIIGLITMLILIINNNYKYLISTYILLVYIFLSLIFKDYQFLFNSSCIISAILVAPDLISSPILKKYQIIYGISIGVISFILIKWVTFYEGAFLAILIVNFIYEIICKIRKKML